MLGEEDGHRIYEDLAVRHVMGSLDEAESGTFRSHLLDCAECRARVGELRSIASDLADVERSERRERAARLVETKQRDEEREDRTEELPPPAPQTPRVLGIVSIGLIIALSVWVFVLRAQNEDLSIDVANLAASASVVNFGESWDLELLAGRVEGTVRTDEERIVVLLDGVSSDATYTATLYDVDGASISSRRLDQPVDGQVQEAWPQPQVDVGRIDVAEQRANVETLVLRAVPAS